MRFHIKVITRARRRYQAETRYANKNATTFHCFERATETEIGAKRERDKDGRVRATKRSILVSGPTSWLTFLSISLGYSQQFFVGGHYDTPPLLTSRNVALTAFII